MSEENFIWDFKIESVKMTPKQQDRLMHRQWKRTINRLQNRARRTNSIVWKQRKIISSLKRFLRFQQKCINIYTVPGAVGRFIFKCKLDDKLCKFQCGVLEPKNKGE